MQTKRIKLSSESLIVLVSLFLLLISNASFWRQLALFLGGLSVAWVNYLSVAIFVFAIFNVLFLVLAPRVLLKPVLVIFILIAASASYFIDHYGAVIDHHALQSALETDARESAEWLSFTMLKHLFFFGLIPSVITIWLFEIKQLNYREAIFRRFFSILGFTALAVLVVGFNQQLFSSLARNHPELRDVLNPINSINAARAYLKKSVASESVAMLSVGADTELGLGYKNHKSKPVVLILVVGESARASSFGILGYPRDTTPELKKLPITAFSEVDSCGTNTATSVPCMFSNLGRARYTEKRANAQENLLDLAKRAGFSVEWIDNNTGSKKVAKRITETSLALGNDAELCSTGSCYDQVLLDALASRLTKIDSNTILVLHQLGSHGPAYYQRTPESFVRFKPICRTVELQNCSRESVLNSYDNSIFYTDYILSQMIEELIQKDAFDSALLYVSDHGESTGEHGYYLHGAPYVIAPTEQTKVPMLLWTSNSFNSRMNLSPSCVASAAKRSTSHDAIFPMILNLLDLKTEAYIKERDPLAGCFRRAGHTQNVNAH